MLLRTRVLPWIVFMGANGVEGENGDFIRNCQATVTPTKIYCDAWVIYMQFRWHLPQHWHDLFPICLQYKLLSSIRYADQMEEGGWGTFMYIHWGRRIYDSCATHTPGLTNKPQFIGVYMQFCQRSEIKDELWWMTIHQSPERES